MKLVCLDLEGVLLPEVSNFNLDKSKPLT